jgi:hypothetical protein
MIRFSGSPLSKPLRLLPVLALVAALLASLAFVMAQTGGAPSPPAGTALPPPGETAKPREKPEKEPKIVRWVCTDRLCGGCDGACSRSGHVAVSRKGHCACTPKAGGKLDEAIRKAFEPHLKSRGGE